VDAYYSEVAGSRYQPVVGTWKPSRGLGTTNQSVPELKIPGAGLTAETLTTAEIGAE
jgi:hypothetical protein